MKRFLGSLLVLFALLPLAACTTIDDTEVGVRRTRVLGTVADQPVGTGPKLTLFHSYTKFPKREVQYPAGNESDISDNLTADNLTVHVDAGYRYVIDPAKVVDLYLKVGKRKDVDRLVYNAYREEVRNAVAQDSAEVLLSRAREGMGERLRQRMNERLRERGITVTEVFIRGITPPPSVKRAIEAKIAAAQEVETERNKVKVVQQRADQRREEARGIADAQRIIDQSLTKEYLEYKRIEALIEAAKGQNNVIIDARGGISPLVNLNR